MEFDEEVQGAEGASREPEAGGRDAPGGPGVTQGVVAGILGGAAVAAFFFVFDLMHGDPFRTPAFLAGVILGGGQTGGAGLITLFTLLHFGVFAVVGAGAVILCEWARLPHNVLTGAVYGLFVCTLLFYLSLMISGTEVLPAPWWPAVLVGNLVAGVVMGTYLRWVGPRPGALGIRNQLQLHVTLREGLLAGMIGAVTVAVWFLVVDLVAGRALYTPGALGSALFLAASGPAAVEVSAATVLGYTAVHVAAFALFGMVVSGLATQAERFPPLVFLLILLAVVFELFFVGLVAILGQWILRQLAWWSVLVGNLLAAATMGGYLWRAHPKLREQIRTNAIWLE